MRWLLVVVAGVGCGDPDPRCEPWTCDTLGVCDGFIGAAVVDGVCVQISGCSDAECPVPIPFEGVSDCSEACE